MPASAASYQLAASYAVSPVFCRFAGEVWGPAGISGPPAPHMLDRHAGIDAGGRLLVIDLGWAARASRAQVETLRPLCEAFIELAPHVVQAMAETLESDQNSDLRVALRVELQARTPFEPLSIEVLAITASCSGLDLARAVFDSTGPHGGLADGSGLIYNDLATRLLRERTQQYRNLCELVLSRTRAAFATMIADSPGLPTPEMMEP